MGEDPAKLAPHTLHTEQEEMQIVFDSISKSYFLTPGESPCSSGLLRAYCTCEGFYTALKVKEEEIVSVLNYEGEKRLFTIFRKVK